VNRSVLSIALIVASAGFSAAQQPSSPAAPPSTAEPHLSIPKIDGAKILAGISASHYHPDDLSGMDCGAVLDWESVIKELKQTPTADRMKILDGMSVEVHAQKNKVAAVTVAWSKGEPTDKEAIEQGTRQMLTGFFQVYWPVFASAMKPSQADSVRIDARSDGGYTIHSATNSAESGFDVDRNLVPTNVFSKTPAMNLQLTLSFAPSPNPVPGDLRWLTREDATISVGTNVTNSTFATDYQTIGAFHIPKRIAIGIGGAYTMPFELIGCSVSKDVIVAPPAK
jgi:hypothetical protein